MEDLQRKLLRTPQKKPPPGFPPGTCAPAGFQVKAPEEQAAEIGRMAIAGPAQPYIAFQPSPMPKRRPPELGESSSPAAPAASSSAASAEPLQPMIMSIASEDEGEESTQRTPGILVSQSNSSHLPSFQVMVARMDKRNKSAISSRSKSRSGSCEEAIESAPS
eukprot:3218029-Amphidinium_carterae.3